MKTILKTYPRAQLPNYGRISLQNFDPAQLAFSYSLDEPRVHHNSIYIRKQTDIETRVIAAGAAIYLYSGAPLRTTNRSLYWTSTSECRLASF